MPPEKCGVVDERNNSDDPEINFSFLSSCYPQFLIFRFYAILQSVIVKIILH